MINNEVIAQIRVRRGRVERSRKLAPRRPPVWLYPWNAEQRYSRILQKHVDDLGKIVERVVFPFISSLVQSRDLDFPEELKTDNFADEADRLNEALTISFNNNVFNAKEAAENTAVEISTFNEKEWQKQIKSALGVNIFTRSPWLNGQIQAFVKENVKLISKMDRDMLDDVEATLLRGLRSGDSSKTIQKNLEKRIDVTKSRARLIARDQVGKFNGDLTKLKQADAGIDKYVWRTSLDERVRASHRVKNNRTYDWNKPPLGTGHPGHDYQCRCYAEPVWAGLFDELNTPLGDN